MTLKGSNMTSAASALWQRRNAALETASALISEKPDMEEWTKADIRLFAYAMAIGRRLEQLN